MPQSWCAELSAVLTFGIVLSNTGFLPKAPLSALGEMLNPTLGKRGRAPQKVLSNREMQESYGDLIAEMTANGQSAPAIVRCLEEECNVKTGQVEATLEPS